MGDSGNVIDEILMSFRLQGSGGASTYVEMAFEEGACKQV